MFNRHRRQESERFVGLRPGDTLCQMRREHASRMASWQEISRRYRDIWTGRGQGVATDGTSWFVTQNDKTPGVSRYSADFSTLEARAEIPRTVAGHVGAVSIVEGVVSIALENPEAVMTFTRDLKNLALVPIRREVERDGIAHLAWCSINPDNGLLYTCDWNFASVLSAYDPGTGSPRPDADIVLDEMVHRVQGAAFTPTGQVYLAADDRLTLREWARNLFGLDDERQQFPGIHCFDAATGNEVDYRRIPISKWPPFREEIEGLGVGEMEIDGVTAHVHLSYLVKDHTWRGDSVIVKSYVVERPDKL